MSSIPCPGSLSTTTHTQIETHTPTRSVVAIDDQSSRLPFRKLLAVLLSLFICLFISFFDQTSVSTALPAIAHDLGAADRINWVGISFLVATTSSQIVIARLSDIFGRKFMLISMIVLFMIGNLLCGFAQSAIWLFTARAISGIGGGGINSLCMIIMSDIVSLKERGKYEGLFGAAIALGSGVGPLIGGALSTVSWRWVFWFTVPISVVCLAQLWWMLPQNKLSGKFIDKVRKVDFMGSVLSLIAIVCILVPISGGGTYYSWRSALVVVMLTVGSILAIGFILVEWRLAALPILPLRLFRIRNILILHTATFMTGLIYYCNLFFLPSYYTDARGFTPIQAGVLLLPLVVIQSLTSSLCGLILTRTRAPKLVIVVGFSVWCIGAGLQTMFGPTTSKSVICGFLFLQGLGAGAIPQTTLVATQASVDTEDRAVVTGARNFFRTLGGALGLVVCTTAKNAVLKHQLSRIPGLTSDSILAIVKSGPELTLGTPFESPVRSAYVVALHTVFVIFVPVAGLSAVMTCFLKPMQLPGDSNTLPLAKPPSLADNEDIALERVRVQRVGGKKSG